MSNQYISGETGLKDEAALLGVDSGFRRRDTSPSTMDRSTFVKTSRFFQRAAAFIMVGASFSALAAQSAEIVHLAGPRATTRMARELIPSAQLAAVTPAAEIVHLAGPRATIRMARELTPSAQLAAVTPAVVLYDAPARLGQACKTRFRVGPRETIAACK